MALRILANVNVEKPLIDFLKSKRVDIKWVTDIDKRMSDEDVILLANNEERVIMTNDKDFGELVFLKKMTTFGILLLRVKGQNISEKKVLLDKLITDYYNKIIGYFTVVKKNKVRFIKL